MTTAENIWPLSIKISGLLPTTLKEQTTQNDVSVGPFFFFSTMHRKSYTMNFVQDMEFVHEVNGTIKWWGWFLLDDQPQNEYKPGFSGQSVGEWANEQVHLCLSAI